MSEPRVGERRPGGRAARVRAAVLAATSQLLDEVGYDRLSVEEIAGRAGVHKTTVYRRWPTIPELVADAVRVQAAADIPTPDTGDVATDLQVLARQVVATVGSEGGARRSRSIVAAASASDDLSAALHAFWADRMAAAAPIVERAVDRGDLPAGTDPTLVVETVVAPIWLRLLLTGEPIDDEFADAVAALVVAGAREAIAS